MIRINLLPYRDERIKRENRRKAAIFLIGVFALGFILFLYNSHLKSNIAALETDIKNTQQELAKFKKILAEIDSIKKELGTLKKKIEVIKGLSKNRKEPVILLETMSELMIPKRMKLINFVEKDKNINIAGVALDDRTIADYMKQLEKKFSDVQLGPIMQFNRDGLKLKKFKLSFINRNPNEPEEPEEEKKDKN
ncbi:PilN domain-containing protein [Desulfococcaceae bacterium HSG7]|nr:PilN domain-containing protein [Desulfococcaceae bacterium HSG9]MDM8555767.1 PilN domain-containing protein [Desulfococcaceae bacterium HSG7]